MKVPVKVLHFLSIHPISLPEVKPWNLWLLGFLCAQQSHSPASPCLICLLSFDMVFSLVILIIYFMALSWPLPVRPLPPGSWYVSRNYCSLFIKTSLIVRVDLALCLPVHRSASSFFLVWVRAKDQMPRPAQNWAQARCGEAGPCRTWRESRPKSWRGIPSLLQVATRAPFDSQIQYTNVCNKYT